MGEFPSGQRGQTVNLLALPSVVRIHLRPFTYLLRATVLARMRLISAIGMYEKRICRSADCFFAIYKYTLAGHWTSSSWTVT